MSGDVAHKIGTTNGLFCCKDSNEIYCSICPTDARIEAWEEHIVDPAHVQTLDQFYQIFEQIDTRSRCRLCDEDFDWRVLKHHARLHTILPWHRPYEEYERSKILFDNRIVEWQTLFHCCICNATFPTFDVAFVHIADPTHQNRKEETADFVYEFPDGITYDFLVSECLIAATETTLECRICDSTKVSVENLSRHAKGLMHKSNRSKFRLEFNERQAEELVQQIDDNFQSEELPAEGSVFEESSEDVGSEESASEELALKESTPQKIETGTSTGNRKIVRQSSDCNYIVKRNSTDSYCTLCNCVFFHHSADNHTRSEDHVDALKTYGCDEITFSSGSDYHCNICNRTMSGPSNVYEHVMGGKHLKALKTSRQQRLLKRPNEARAMKRSEEDTKEVSQTDGNYDPDSGNNGHGNYITSLKDNAFYCRCCNVTVPGPENLYLHLQGKRHLRLCTLSENQRVRIRPHNIGSARRPDVNLSEDGLQSLHDTFVNQQIETPKRLDRNSPGTEERRFGFPSTSGKPQIKMEKSLESSKITNVKSQTKEDYYSTPENAFGLQQHRTSRDSVETPRPEVVFQANDERYSDSSTETDKRQGRTTRSLAIPRKPKHNREQIIDSLKKCNVNSQTKEEHYSTWDKTLGLPQVSLHRGGFETSRRPEVDFTAKDECRSDSSDGSDKRRGQRTSSLAIPRRPKHIPEKVFESFEIPKINSQKKEEYYSPLENTFGSQQSGISRDSFQAPKRPEVAIQARNGRPGDSSSDSDKRQPPRTTHEQVIPRRPKHVPDRILKSSTCHYLVKVNDAYFRCQVCDCIISGSSSNINIHVTGNHHIAALKRYGCEYITLTGGNVYYCECCDLDIARLENVHQHIKSDSHIKSVTGIDRQKLLSDEKTSGRANSHIKKDSNVSFSAGIDRQQLQLSSNEKTSGRANPHVKKDSNVSFSAGIDRQQKPSDEKTSGRVNPHIQKDYNLSSLAGIDRQQLQLLSDQKIFERVEIPDRSEDLRESARPTSPSIYIIKLNDKVSHCELCDVNLVGSSETSEHAAGADHAATMEKLGCDCVVLVDGDDHYCKSCKCNISGSENVCTHVRGRRHFFGLRQFLDRQQLQTAKRSLNRLKTTEEPDSNSALSMVTTEMSKMVKKFRMLERKNRRNQTTMAQLVVPAVAI